MTTLYQLTFYVPSHHLEVVKQAIFSAGAGRHKNYELCAWQTPGQGQFKPLPGSTPYLGQINKVEFVQEVKVETIVEAHCIRNVLTALLDTHPYQQPAYAVFPMLTLADFC